jgi:hypothetical protein
MSFMTKNHTERQIVIYSRRFNWKQNLGIVLITPPENHGDYMNERPMNV